MPGEKQAWPMVAACWSPAMPEIAIAPPNSSGTLSPKLAEESFTSGSIERGTRRIFRSSSSHSPGVDVEQQRARGVGGVGGVHLAAGQPPQQIAIDGAEQQFAALARSRAPGTWSRIQATLVPEK